MGFQYIACRDNPFLESESGIAQVLISLFQIFLRHDKFLGRLVYLENRLADLQFYLFFGIVQLVPADARFGLGGFYLVDAFSPVPDRYAAMTPTFHMPLNLFSKLLNTDGLVAI